jgi:hypothetical protein
MTAEVEVQVALVLHHRCGWLRVPDVKCPQLGTGHAVHAGFGSTGAEIHVLIAVSPQGLVEATDAPVRRERPSGVHRQGPLGAQLDGAVGVEVVQSLTQFRADEGPLASMRRATGYLRPHLLEAARANSADQIGARQGWQPLHRPEDDMARVQRMSGTEAGHRVAPEYEVAVQHDEQ